MVISNWGLGKEFPGCPEDEKDNGDSNGESQPAERKEEEGKNEVGEGNTIEEFHDLTVDGKQWTAVCHLRSIVQFINHIIRFLDGNEVILIEICAKCGEFARGVGA